MIKQSILLVFFTLVFTACVERGHTPKPAMNTFMEKPIIASYSTKKIHIKTQPIRKDKTPVISQQTKVLQKSNVIEKPSENINETMNKNNSFFALSDETKNKISGFFVIIIGIIILI